MAPVTEAEQLLKELREKWMRDAICMLPEAPSAHDPAAAWAMGYSEALEHCAKAILDLLSSSREERTTPKDDRQELLMALRVIASQFCEQRALHGRPCGGDDPFCSSCLAFTAAEKAEGR